MVEIIYMKRINGLLHTADVVIPSILEQIEGEHFDYIIHDSMFGCGRLIAQILNLPAINSCTSFAQDEKSFEQMLGYLSKNIPVKIHDRIHNDFQNLTKGIAEKYGVEIASPYEVFVIQHHLLLCIQLRSSNLLEIHLMTHLNLWDHLSHKRKMKTLILIQLK